MNAQYTLKVIKLLNAEANFKANLNYNSRFGKTSLSIDELEAIEDRLRNEMTCAIAQDEIVTEAGDKLAHEIKEKYFPDFEI